MADIVQITEELVDALGYQQTGSVSDALAVIRLTQQLQVLRPISASREGSHHSFSNAELMDIRQRAERFVDANPAGSGGGNRQFRFLGIGCFRGRG